MSSIAGMITSLKNNKRSRISTFDKIKNFKKGKEKKLHFKNCKIKGRYLNKIFLIDNKIKNNQLGFND